MDLHSTSRFSNDAKVPNWYGSHETFNYEFAEGLWDPHKRPSFYNIAGGSMTQLVETNIPEVLGVRGVQIDEITSLANKYHLKDDRVAQGLSAHLDWKREHLRQADIIMSKLLLYPTGKDLESVLWRTLICDVTLNLERAPPGYRDFYHAWRNMLGMGIKPQDKTEHKPFREAIDAFNDDKVFGSTAGGYVGMFPAAARPSDLIWVLFGGEFPFVLRKMGRGQNFQLVGQCYIHGRMEPGDVKLEDYKEQTVYLGGTYAPIDEKWDTVLVKEEPILSY